MAKANCNWWQYSRWVYNIGRSEKQLAYTTAEKTAARSFIAGIYTSRAALAPRLDNKIVEKALNTAGTAYDLSKLTSATLGKMLCLIGRSLKVDAPTTAEKTLCDSLIAATASRKNRFIAEDESSSSSSSADESSSSSSVQEESSSSGE